MRPTTVQTRAIPSGFGFGFGIHNRLRAFLKSASKPARVAVRRVARPRALDRGLAIKAMKLAETVSHTAAAEFLEAETSIDLSSVAQLFRANAAGADDEAWVRHTNAYLTPYGLAPISLSAGGQPRFHRLTAGAERPPVLGPKVTVIMAAYKAGRTIEHAARSILAQSWRNLELLIVDDASPDDTGSAMARLAARDARVRVITNSCNVGPYVSKNRALALATGDFVTGHDADDWAHPDRIARQMAGLSAVPARAAGLAYMLRLDAQGRYNEFRSIGGWAFDGAARVASISALFRLDMFRQQLGAWDCVRFGGDSELIERSRRVLGPGFHTERLIAMLCLDAEGSLTNDPVHGVGKPAGGGLSKSRTAYRDAWMAWHADLDPLAAKLPFPHNPRRFAAPSAMLVDEALL